MNVSTLLTKDYQNITNWSLIKTNPIQTQSNPIQSQLKPIKCQNKPNQTQSNPISKSHSHANSYPDSVATIGFGSFWNRQEPTMLTGYRKRSPQWHRSMSAYLHGYIQDAGTIFCPSAPEKYKHLQQAWDARDDWDNPDTGPVPDPVIGVYCFYWNYIGFLAEDRPVFKGPRTPFGGLGQGKLLVSDYFGYDHWRSPNAYGSCEKFAKAAITPGTYVSSAFWTCREGGGEVDLATLKIELHAGYIDGHVQGYYPSETVPMRVSISPDGTVPYPDGVGPGEFHLPRNGLR